MWYGEGKCYGKSFKHRGDGLTCFEPRVMGFGKLILERKRRQERPRKGKAEKKKSLNPNVICAI